MGDIPFMDSRVVLWSTDFLCTSGRLVEDCKGKNWPALFILGMELHEGGSWDVVSKRDCFPVLGLLLHLPHQSMATCSSADRSGTLPPPLSSKSAVLTTHQSLPFNGSNISKPTCPNQKDLMFLPKPLLLPLLSATLTDGHNIHAGAGVGFWRSPNILVGPSLLAANIAGRAHIPLVAQATTSFSDSGLLGLAWNTWGLESSLLWGPGLLQGPGLCIPGL